MRSQNTEAFYLLTPERKSKRFNFYSARYKGLCASAGHDALKCRYSVAQAEWRKL